MVAALTYMLEPRTTMKSVILLDGGLFPLQTLIISKLLMLVGLTKAQVTNTLIPMPKGLIITHTSAIIQIADGLIGL